MAKEIKKLKHNDWVSLNEIKWPEEDIKSYVFSHEERCNGKIISILPFKYDKELDKYQLLLRNEVTPCWSGIEHNVSTITGGVENNDPDQTAIDELKEEAGYVIDNNKLIYLGWCFGIKSSDSIYYLYSCDLSNAKETEIDPEDLESKSYNFFADNIDDMIDPFGYVIYYKLLKYLS